MKQVLVVDTKMTFDGKHICDSCPIWNKETYCCEYDRNTENKGCPLRPLPKMVEVPDDAYVADYLDFDLGWNACLKAITGETE